MLQIHLSSPRASSRPREKDETPSDGPLFSLPINLPARVVDDVADGAWTHNFLPSQTNLSFFSAASFAAGLGIKIAYFERTNNGTAYLISDAALLVESFL